MNLVKDKEMRRRGDEEMNDEMMHDTVVLGVDVG